MHGIKRMVGVLMSYHSCCWTFDHASLRGWSMLLSRALAVASSYFAQGWRQKHIFTIRYIATLAFSDAAAGECLGGRGVELFPPSSCACSPSSRKRCRSSMQDDDTRENTIPSIAYLGLLEVCCGVEDTGLKMDILRRPNMPWRIACSRAH